MSVRIMTKRVTEEHEDVDEVRKSLDLLSKGMLKLGLYFFWYVYEHLPIYYRRNLANEGATDGTSIFLSSKFLDLNFNHQLFVLLHEILHVVYNHPDTLARKIGKSPTNYERNIIQIVGNVIMDAVINAQLINLLEGKLSSTRFIKDEYVNPEVVNKLIDDDVAELGFALGMDRLMYLINTGVVEVKAFTPSGNEVDLSSSNIEDAAREGGMLLITFFNKKTNGEFKVAVRFDLTSYGSGKETKGASTKESQTDSTGEERSEYAEGGQGDAKSDENITYGKVCGKSDVGEKPILVKRPITNSKPVNTDDINKIVRNAIDFDMAKRVMDGEKSAGAGICMDSIYEMLNISSKKPKWIDRLKIFVADYLGSFKLYTWQKIHKRAPYLKPGYYRVGTPHVVILLDTSGSMLDSSLERALNEIFGLIESEPDVRVTLYQWSSACSLPKRVDRHFIQKVKTHRKIPVLTGGTEIEPALDSVLKSVSKDDLVLIMTDGYIYDIEKDEVQKKLQELTKRSAKTLFLTTSAVPKLPSDIEVIKLE